MSAAGGNPSEPDATGRNCRARSPNRRGSPTPVDRMGTVAMFAPDWLFYDVAVVARCG